MTVKKHYYTAEEDEWLRQHITSCESFKNLAEMFNKRFGTDLTPQAIQSKCNKTMGIHIGHNSGQFVKNHKSYVKTNKIGDEVERNGYIHVKYNNVRHYGKTSYTNLKENWMPKQRYVYEQHHGSIPEGYIVVFLNNDKKDFSPENLYAIPRKINAMMNTNRWFTSKRENTLTAIKLCELMCAIKGVI